MVKTFSVVAARTARTKPAACDRLESAVGPFRQKFNAVSDGLAHLEQVYQREHDAQQRLIQESERLE
jgi:hypothetical protein